MTAAIASDLAGVPEALWKALAAAPHLLLMLDYDGTLAPFRERRDEARPAPGVRRRFDRLAADRRVTIAVVSGRSLADLATVLGPVGAILVGEHGWEIRWADGRVARYEIPAAGARALDRAAAEAAARGLAERLERKRTALVLHTRGLPAERAMRVEDEAARLWSAAAAPPSSLRLDRIDGGLELRACGRDKGAAVREVRSAAPPGALTVYLGDDATDEDAFRELRDRGYGIGVGRGRDRSLASGRLPSVAAVETFLERWLEILAPRPGR